MTGCIRYNWNDGWDNIDACGVGTSLKPGECRSRFRARNALLGRLIRDYLDVDTNVYLILAEDRQSDCYLRPDAVVVPGQITTGVRGKCLPTS